MGDLHQSSHRPPLRGPSRGFLAKPQIRPTSRLYLRAAIDELPEMNATKVVALHRRIVNGDYQIDSERLAGKLIELESSLDSE